MTTAEAVVSALTAHGVDTIYALPGVHNDPLFDALFRSMDKIRTVHTRHEQGCALMALGAALATGNPQAFAVVPGPGLLNSATALLTAYGTNAPVLGADRPDPKLRDRTRAWPPARDARPAGQCSLASSISPPASRLPPTGRLWSPRRCGRCAAAGGGRPRSNARSMCGDAARSCLPSPNPSRCRNCRSTKTAFLPQRNGSARQNAR